MSMVTTRTFYNGEIWGVRPCTAAQRQITTQKYSENASAPFAPFAAKLSCTNMAIILSCLYSSNGCKLVQPECRIKLECCRQGIS